MNVYKYTTKVNKEGTFEIPSEIKKKINDNQEIEIILRILSFIDDLETDLGISDLSKNHDKYFYGDNSGK